STAICTISPTLLQTPRCHCLRITSARLWTVRRFQNPVSQASIPSHCQHRKNNHFQAVSTPVASKLQLSNCLAVNNHCSTRKPLQQRFHRKKLHPRRNHLRISLCHTSQAPVKRFPGRSSRQPRSKTIK